MSLPKAVINHWVNALRLNDWKITIYYTPEEEMGEALLGDVSWWLHLKEATIRLNQKHAERYEEILIHELLHLVLVNITDYCDSRMKNSTIKDLMIEQPINVLTKALLESHQKENNVQKTKTKKKRT